MLSFARKSDHGTKPGVCFLCIEGGKGKMDVNPNKVKFIIATAAFAAFLATFNETYLNIGFTPIMADLGVGVSTVQWLSTAYMLGAAVMVPVSAFMYRRVPTRPLFVVTTAFLVAGSVVGALAGSFAMLLIGRIIQSIGTGMLIPIGMNITLDVAPREKLGTFMGIMGAMTTLGPSLSVIIAGFILAFAEWRVLLWVFAGLSLLCMLFGAFALQNVAKLTNPKLDALSVILVSLGLIGILYGLSTVFSGNVALALIIAAVGVVFIALFIRRQGKIKEPLLDLRPLRIKPFAAGVIINMLSLIIIFAMNIIMPIFMQSTMGASSMKASLTLFPAIVLCCIVSPIAGKIYDRQGEKKLLLTGFICICIFAAALSVMNDSFVIMALLYIPVICGSALIIGPVQSFALSRLSYELNPYGVTVMSTGFQVAGCLGASIFTGVYSMVLAGGTSTGMAATAAADRAFMVVALMASAFALIGVAVTIYIRRFGKPEAKEPTEENPLMSIMKKDVYTISGDDRLVDALELITEKKISGAPVTDSNGALIGFISDGDIMRFLSDEHPLFANAYSFVTMDFDSKLQHLMNIKVKDIAKKRVITVDADEDMGEICRIMSDRHVKKAPVMKDGEMVGMINRSNITKYALGKLTN